MSFPTVPTASPILLDAYNNLNSLLLPPPSTFFYPLVESFAAVHDPLTEEHGQKIFIASMALREAGVQVEHTIRDLPKLDRDGKVEGGGLSPMLSLSEVKRSRLRAKLQSHSNPRIPPSIPTSKETLLRASQERKARFDAEMAREEEEALEEFKRGLREAVLLVPGI